MHKNVEPNMLSKQLDVPKCYQGDRTLVLRKHMPQGINELIHLITNEPPIGTGNPPRTHLDKTIANQPIRPIPPTHSNLNRRQSQLTRHARITYTQQRSIWERE